MRLDDLTVTVPTKNESANIRPFLASLDPRVHLVVVDASTDDTRDIIAAVRPERTTVLHNEGFIPEARQLALETARTEWVLFTDADMSLGADYWGRWERLSIRPTTGIMQGAKLSADDQYQTYYRLFSAGIRLASWATIPAGSGSNMIVRRRALLDVGGFDVQMKANEDVEALWRIRRAGWGVRYDGGLRVYERDHRRLDDGVVMKTLHGWVRPLMMMTGLGADRVRGSSWGYWNDADLGNHAAKKQRERRGADRGAQ